MLNGMRAEQFTEPLAFHAEGPIWWPDDGSAVANTLRWVDLTAGVVLTAAADGGVRRTRVGSPIAAFLRPRVGGGAVVATERGISVTDDPELTGLRPFTTLIDGPEARLNEGGCSPAGTLFAGSMRYDQARGGAALVEVDPSGGVRAVRGDATVSNGIDWSPDGSLAYYNDTPTRGTVVYSWDADAGLHDPRRLFALAEDDEAGGPDGLCVDAAGNVWTAIYGGSRVECRDPSGRLVEVVELPVANVTACTFGGERLDRLFITTTRENVAEGSQPTAGALYVAEPGVTGQRVRCFAG